MRALSPRFIAITDKIGFHNQTVGGAAALGNPINGLRGDTAEEMRAVEEEFQLGRATSTEAPASLATWTPATAAWTTKVAESCGGERAIMMNWPGLFERLDG